MALEIAAAIIGIVAAAGKIVEILGPLVSAYKNAPSSAAIVQTEIKTCSIILCALKELFDDLSKTAPKRKRLLQIDQLVTTLSEGVLVFDELENIVKDLESPSLALRHRIKWAFEQDSFASHISRLQNFKQSIGIILNILQCESDMEAGRGRDELLTLTSAILQSNVELSRRMTYLESHFATSRSVRTLRTASIAATGTSHNDDMASRFDNLYHTIPATRYYDFEFEHELESSAVYRRVTTDATDVSFCSSVVRSHAWTALSEISLSDISVISVIALPIAMIEIGNAYHYEFANMDNTVDAKSVHASPIQRSDVAALRENDTASQSSEITHMHNRRHTRSLDNFLDESAELAPSDVNSTTLRSSDHEVEEQTSAPEESCTSQSIFPTRRRIESFYPDHHKRPNGSLRVMVVGGELAGADQLMSRVSTTSHVSKTFFGSASVYSTEDPVRCYFEVSSPPPKYMSHWASACAECEDDTIFMLIYSTNCRVSFLRIRRYHQRILRLTKTKLDKIILVGNQDDVTFDRVISTQQGQNLADELGCAFYEVSENGLSSLRRALVDLFRTSRVKGKEAERPRSTLFIPGAEVLSSAKEIMKDYGAYDMLRSMPGYDKCTAIDIEASDSDLDPDP